MGDLTDFKELVGLYDMAKLRACQHFINSAIQNLLNGSTPQLGTSQLSVNPSVKNVNDFVQIQNDFIDSTEHGLLCAELQSLGFNYKTKSEAVQNRFISCLSEPYTWKSKHGDVVNKPLDIADFPTIKSIMDKVNINFKCKMNSLLVSCYTNGKVNVRLHQDDESSLDSDQPIYVYQLGLHAGLNGWL